MKVSTNKKEVNDLGRDRAEVISGIEAELQCMEAFLYQGFTLQDYIDSQKHLIEILQGLNKDTQQEVK
jgi:hypothetical protein